MNNWLIVILSFISLLVVFYLIFHPESIFKKGKE